MLLCIDSLMPLWISYERHTSVATKDGCEINHQLWCFNIVCGVYKIFSTQNRLLSWDPPYHPHTYCIVHAHLCTSILYAHTVWVIKRRDHGNHLSWAAFCHHSNHIPWSRASVPQDSKALCRDSLYTHTHTHDWTCPQRPKCSTITVQTHTNTHIFNCLSDIMFLPY